MAKANDPVLLAALEKAYTARAKLFHHGVKAAKIDLLVAEIDAIDASAFNWQRVPGLSTAAAAQLLRAGVLPHQVFAHPEIILARPHLLAYYRNLATISQKGISQLLFSTSGFEAGTRRISEERANDVCKALTNRSTI